MPSCRRAAALTCGFVLALATAADARNGVLTQAVQQPGQTRTVAAGTLIVTPRYNVRSVRVAVPESLRVSEANRYFPIADIVWRGDPAGDRHAQVRAIFEAAAAAATAQMRSGPAVTVDIQVIRFHALTEKTRYTVGGVHSLHFILTVRDARTDAILDGPRQVVADVKAAGGNRAIAEDAAGRTQKVVITEALTRALMRELGTTVGVVG